MAKTALLSVILLLVATACGDDGSGTECVSSVECGVGETCEDGRCVATPDTGVPSDSGVDALDTGVPDTGPPIGSGCSSDLRDVLDATGAVLSTCADDEGCFEGRCIAACEAAASSRGNVGCSFVAPTPPSYPPALPPCHAVFVTNAWPLPARLTVSRGATTYDATTFARIAQNGVPATEWDPLPATGLPPNQVAVVFLSSDPASIMPENSVPLSCPITPAVDASTYVPGTGTGDAFRISADVPVSAYDILPYGGARSHFPSAGLLLPTSAWGTEYVLTATPPGTHSAPGPLWGQIVALEDDTTVRVRPTAALPMGGGLPAAPIGAITSMSLAAGQYAQWELPTGSSDLSGSAVIADKPVAVFTGSRFFRLQPMPGPGGEATHQQNLPVAALSSTYVASPFETRRADLMPEDVHYRLVGAFDGTTLAYDPPVAGAPATLDAGGVADFTAAGAFRVSSQDDAHPFAAAQIMPTANVTGGSRPGATDPIFAPRLGDEEFVVMFPPAQWLDRYVFFTDPSYATTNLVVTRADDGSGFSPVRIDCVGELSGWQPVGTDGAYETTTIDLVRADLSVGGCDNGLHEASSDGPFGVVVWGLDTYASYAYPAGGNASTLEELPPLF